MAEMNKHHKKGLAALRAGMDRETGLKYRKLGKLPSEIPAKPRTYLTRKDPFDRDWPLIAAMLADIPDLDAKTIFEHLQGLEPGRYQDGQLRTLQRRVGRWRGQNGPEKEVFFSQDHRPGECAQADFTWCTELKITIRGVAFAHMLFHMVLPYSNWEWATVALSESLLALRHGIQTSLVRLGRKPKKFQTDNSTAATHELGTGKRGFNDDYMAVMRHFDMQPQTIGIGESEQNGDVEAGNGALKRRLERKLKIRGSRDFDSEQAYEIWVQSECDLANSGRCERLAEELALMGALNPARLCEHVELDVPVSQWSTIRVKSCVYSVPSRLIGHQVRVHLSERLLIVFFNGIEQLRTERLTGKSQRIDYRHIIWSLVRKPNAFARYHYREELFPSLTFRRAYDALAKSIIHELRTDVAYLRLLYLAASTLQVEVEIAVELLLESGVLPTSEAVKVLIGKEKAVGLLEMPVLKPDLVLYDGLLGSMTVH